MDLFQCIKLYKDSDDDGENEDKVLHKKYKILLYIIVFCMKISKISKLTVRLPVSFHSQIYLEFRIYYPGVMSQAHSGFSAK